MATLVLSTVGTLLGGPVGGAIGSLLGQSIDQQLWGPGPREGPRLGDLSVQTSSYGSAIPRIFGTMRVAGSIVWSTDLQEDSQTEGAKGQPETVTYSYSASFAVALSSRRIRNVRRIWADGKLIRTSEGQFTVSTGFRFHDGSEDQLVDPLIASMEGMDAAPAYRGIALAVFDHLQLADFGNRIPFLTFEVEADPEPVPPKLILNETSDGVIACSESSPSISGYAAHGRTITAALEPLVETLGIPLFDNGSVLASPVSVLVSAADNELGCTAGHDPIPRIERSQIPMRDLPSVLSLGYYDPNRDYQAGVARAAVEDTAAADHKLELPAVLHATAAKALAETCVGRRWAERERVIVRLPPSFLGLRPGTLLKFSDAEPWRADRVTVDSMTVLTELRPVSAKIEDLPADPGRVLPSLGVGPAPTTVSLIELPDDGTAEGNDPVIAVAASTSSRSWRPVPLQVEIGGRVFDMRSAASQAVIGTAVTALARGTSSLFDLLNSVDVELLNHDHWLESRDDLALSDMANLALIGSELVQFGEAVPIGPNLFRLRRLLRGRVGSEWAMGLHDAGEQFVLLEPSRLRRLPLTSAQVGATVLVTPSGLADSAAIAAEAVVSGDALRPPSPVHLRASLNADGSLSCNWVRRSRRGWAWLDGVDAPLDCSAERYRVTLRSSAAAIESETSLPHAEFSASDVASLQATQAVVAVVQVGDLAVSREASTTINFG